MSWRTVVVSNRAKLDFKMNYMIVRTEDITHKIYISEIYMVIIESTAVSLTAVLLNELIKAKIKIIFCDAMRNPSCEVLSYYGAHNTSGRCQSQVQWKEEYKGTLWTDIVRTKIYNQSRLLKKYNHAEYSLLEQYIRELTYRDETQREGHAAKVYFNALFGKDFTREADNNINAALNYGYSILLSAISREISALGYLTQFGLCHHNQFNYFNLSSDLIEPLRPLIDRNVLLMDHINFVREDKYRLVGLLSEEVRIDGKVQMLSAAIRIYCKSITDALTNEDLSLVRFVEYEL